VLAGQLPEMGLWQSLRSLLYPQDIERAESALAHFDLADKLFDRVDRLSGGERQRVGLARLVASSAQLLLVDEPLSALDPERARQAVQSLITVARARGATLVSTLHHVEMALQHFPRIVGMRDGALAFDLPATQVSPALLQELYASHLDELTGPPPVIDLAVSGSPVVAMQCR
jgi:phosphonate transport system ATP-binding protein